MFRFFKKRNEKNSIGNTIKIDIGNSTVKMNNGIELKSFLNVTEEISHELVNNITNSYKNGNKCLLIGGNGKTNASYCKKDIENIIDVILFGLSQFQYEKYNITLLLPLNQVNDIKFFRQKLENKHFLIEVNSENRHISIGKVNLAVEGEEIIKFLKVEKEYNTIVEIGNGTTEVYVYNELNYLVNRVSFNIGTRNILGSIIGTTKTLTISALNGWFNNNVKMSSNTNKLKEKVSIGLLEELKSLLEVSIFNIIPPHSKIHFLGGGALFLKKELKKVFKDYNTKFYDEKTSKFCNVLYMKEEKTMTVDERRKIVSENKHLGGKRISEKFGIDYQLVRNDLHLLNKN